MSVMDGEVPIFDRTFCCSLLEEFRRTMRGLLFDLCDELEGNYGRECSTLRLPVNYFRTVGRALRLENFANWKVVGWIEELNEFLYFLDVLCQIRREPRGHASPEFVFQFFNDCQAQLYEHYYFDALFPRGEPEARGLGKRLGSLCISLAHAATRESLFLVPGLPCEWLGAVRKRAWTVAYSLGPNFERAEAGGRIYQGLDGAYLEPRWFSGRKGGQEAIVAGITFTPRGAEVTVGGVTRALPGGSGLDARAWNYVPPDWIRPPDERGLEGLTLGDTLVYGKDREPARVIASGAALGNRIRRALAVLEARWPDGALLFSVLTSRVIPLSAKGVVSYSYRHRSGLSFINVFERDDLDLLDDLVHENSHHYLNLVLRKDPLLRGGGGEEIFYSPWRRSLRPLRGILHATFTFTMGALLFSSLSSGASGKPSPGGGHASLRRGMPRFNRNLLRARYRGLEEIASVLYSIRDLYRAGQRLGWLTARGLSLVRTLERQIHRAARVLTPFEEQVLRSGYGPQLRRHLKELETARITYQQWRDRAR